MHSTIRTFKNGPEQLWRVDHGHLTSSVNAILLTAGDNNDLATVYAAVL